jgi:hypothetical protein
MLWLAMVGSVFLTSTLLFGMSMVVFMVIVILYYTNGNKCLLTGRRWDSISLLLSLRSDLFRNCGSVARSTSSQHTQSRGNTLPECPIAKC